MPVYRVATNTYATHLFHGGARSSATGGGIINSAGYAGGVQMRLVATPKLVLLRSKPFPNGSGVAEDGRTNRFPDLWLPYISEAYATEATAAFDAPAATVQAGAVSVAATAATSAFDAPAATVQAGVVSVAAAAAASAFDAPNASVVVTALADAVAAVATFDAAGATVTPGAVSVAAAAAVATFDAPASSVLPGEVSVPATAASAAFSAPAATVLPGSVSVPATSATSAFDAPAAAVEPGRVDVAASVSSAAFDAPASTVTPGAVQTIATAAVAAFDAPVAMVAPGVVSADAISSSASTDAPEASVEPGVVTALAAAASATFHAPWAYVENYNGLSVDAVAASADFDAPDASVELAQPYVRRKRISFQEGPMPGPGGGAGAGSSGILGGGSSTALGRYFNFAKRPAPRYGIGGIMDDTQLIVQRHVTTSDRVARNLWMGNAPLCDTEDSRRMHHRFDVLVLAAMEHQPSSVCFPGIKVIHAPIDDGHDVPENDYRIVQKASILVAQALRHDKRVLVTCWQGRNRSGFIVAMALVRLGVHPDQAIAMVRRARGEHALSNQAFVNLIRMAGR